MRHSTYTALFRTIAEDHKLIAHDAATHQAFARLILSAWPSLELQIMEFIASVKSSMNFPCLLLQTYEADFPDNQSDNVYRVMNGAAILLDQYDSVDDFDSQESALDSTEQLADDVLSYLRRYCLQHPSSMSLDLIRCTTEKVLLPEQLLCGTRLNFSFRITANVNLKYDPTRWTTGLP